jgi:hypothetical protein
VGTSAAGVPNLLIFVRPIFSWSPGLVHMCHIRTHTHTRASVVIGIGGIVAASRRLSKPPRLRLHMTLLKLLRAWALSRALSRQLHPRGCRWRLNPGSADNLFGFEKISWRDDVRYCTDHVRLGRPSMPESSIVGVVWHMSCQYAIACQVSTLPRGR